MNKPQSARVGSAAAQLLTLSIALNQALREGRSELVVVLAEAKIVAVDRWIAEKRAENPGCFDLSPMQGAVADYCEGN